MNLRSVLVLAAALAVVGLTVAAWADDNPVRPGPVKEGLRDGAPKEGPRDGERRPPALGEGLNLTEEQKAKFAELREWIQTNMQAADTKEKKLEVIKQAVEKAKAFLTAEQVAKLQERLEKGPMSRPTSGPASRPGEGPLARLQAVLEKLGVTDEQRAKAREIMDKAVADAKDATGDQKGQIIRAAIEKIKTDVLTAEQREKFAAMMADRPGSRPAEGERKREGGMKEGAHKEGGLKHERAGEGRPAEGK
jgi:Spy/CpxP family protein refolding chaperone